LKRPLVDSIVYYLRAISRGVRVKEYGGELELVGKKNYVASIPYLKR
jgi:hypothetical protein